MQYLIKKKKLILNLFYYYIKPNNEIKKKISLYIVLKILLKHDLFTKNVIIVRILIN